MQFDSKTIANYSRGHVWRLY